MNYKHRSYFKSRPDIVQIFEDLEDLLDFCRLAYLPFDESHLYNRASYVWRAFEKEHGSKTPVKPYRRTNSQKPKTAPKKREGSSTSARTHSRPQHAAK